MSSDAIRRLWHRVQALVGRGRLTLVDDSGVVQIVQSRVIGDEVKGEIPRFADYGFVSFPPQDTDSLVVFMAGERSMGIVIATNNQTFRMRGLATGEVAIHDDKGRFVYLSAAGIHVQGKDDPITVDTTSNIVATAGGNVTATAGGNITLDASGDILLRAGGTITLQAPAVAIDTTALTATAATATVTAEVTITGDTAITGDTSTLGALTNNGHDVGDAHEHDPGTYQVGATPVTGLSGGVTP